MPNTSKIIVDDYHGAYVAVTHLIEQGARRIAHIAGPELSYTSLQRKKGYKDALRDHDLPIRPDLILNCKRVNLEEGREFGKFLAQNRHLADAIFAVTDEVAIGAMMALKENGVRIPEEIKLIGFSDWEMAAFVEPSLSSVFQPSYEMGKLAAEILIQEIIANKNEEPFFHDTIMLKTHLTIRNSSKNKAS